MRSPDCELALNLQQRDQAIRTLHFLLRYHIQIVIQACKGEADPPRGFALWRCSSGVWASTHTWRCFLRAVHSLYAEQESQHETWFMN